MEYKQVILMRTDLKLNKGKVGAQAAHASVEATLRAEKHDAERVRRWRQGGMKKILLKVADEKELLRYMQLAKDEGMVTALITDAGRTIVEPGTRTCVALGPDNEEKIDRISRNLSLF